MLLGLRSDDKNLDIEFSFLEIDRNSGLFSLGIRERKRVLRQAALHGKFDELFNLGAH